MRIDLLRISAKIQSKPRLRPEKEKPNKVHYVLKFIPHNFSHVKLIPLSYQFWAGAVIFAQS